MPTIEIADYPQLRCITWDRPSETFIDERNAFALYEANWRFVDLQSMLPHELALIERLKLEIGRGVMYV